MRQLGKLADEANIGHKGARNAMHRLMDWWDIVELGSGTRASTLRFRVRDGLPLCPDRTRPEGVRDARSDADVFRWEGIGKSAARLFAHLDLEPRSASELAAALGVQEGTVRRHLRKLQPYGLAVRVMDGWIRGDRDLEAIAEELGVAGRGAAQKDQHRVRAKQRKEHLQSPARASRHRKELEWWLVWWDSLAEGVMPRAA